MPDLIKMKLNPDGSLAIKLEPNLKLQLESEFSEIVGKQFDAAKKWYGSPDTPKATKDKYEAVWTRLLAEMNFLYQLLKRCGISDGEITELTKLPF